MNWTDLLSNKRYAQPHKSPDIRSSFQRDYERKTATSKEMTVFVYRDAIDYIEFSFHSVSK